MSICNDCTIRPEDIGTGAAMCETVHGTVYPLTPACHLFRGNKTVELKECGPDITPRDFFAGCALMARGPKCIELSLARAMGTGTEIDPKYLEFDWAYTFADAMLKAREGE